MRKVKGPRKQKKQKKKGGFLEIYRKIVLFLHIIVLHLVIVNT